MSPSRLSGVIAAAPSHREVAPAAAGQTDRYLHEPGPPPCQAASHSEIRFVRFSGRPDTVGSSSSTSWACLVPLTLGKTVPAVLTRSRSQQTELRSPPARRLAARSSPLDPQRHSKLESQLTRVSTRKLPAEIRSQQWRASSPTSC